ncbi:MAG: hypothetical protein NPIRA04_30820 [Nitrospirales bacterium]|nr:MAG: hypothetical protein NPIRA04_30820 [Nitrospirales bacterium]
MKSDLMDELIRSYLLSLSQLFPISSSFFRFSTDYDITGTIA